MGFMQRMFGREERAGPRPNQNGLISVGSGWGDFAEYFGIAAGKIDLPPVTIESALEVPAYGGGVGFLTRTLAALPLHAYRNSDGDATRVTGELDMLLNEAPNPEWSSFSWRQYMWQQVFTGGRACTWIERAGDKVVALWPMDPTQTTVARIGGRKVYRFGGIEYPATDVIDVPWMLRTDQIGHYSPVSKGRKALSLAIAMGDFASTFFAGGGVPPLALEGPQPQGPEAFKRAQGDISRAIDNAKQAGTSFFGLPPGHKLSPIGFEPAKGQMVEARLFQLQEIGRLLGLPPVFLGDLSKGNFANTEQQDLQLAKHTITHWAVSLEDELNLKLFGQRRRSRYIKHQLDALQRGAFKDRIEAMARGIQTGQLMPDEARALENRPPKPHGDKLYIQGATVPLGTQPVVKAPPTKDQGDGANDDAGDDA